MTERVWFKVILLLEEQPVIQHSECVAGVSSNKDTSILNVASIHIWSTHTHKTVTQKQQQANNIMIHRAYPYQSTNQNQWNGCWKKSPTTTWDVFETTVNNRINYINYLSLNWWVDPGFLVQQHQHRWGIQGTRHSTSSCGPQGRQCRRSWSQWTWRPGETTGRWCQGSDMFKNTMVSRHESWWILARNPITTIFLHGENIYCSDYVCI